jgi:hypothetical protein
MVDDAARHMDDQVAQLEVDLVRLALLARRVRLRRA